MRLVIAECTVDYHGRLDAHLPRSRRLIMIKADGCVAVHADGGAYKPLNWMSAPNTLEEGDGLWLVTNPKGERLEITIHEVFSDISHELGIDPGLEKDGVETHLQELLAENPEVIEEGLKLIRREYPTAIGPIDMLCSDPEGGTVAVEVKRRGEISGVEQLTRYLTQLELDPRLTPVRGVLVATSVAPQARVLAESRLLGVREVDYQLLRDPDSGAPRLFDHYH